MTKCDVKNMDNAIVSKYAFKVSFGDIPNVEFIRNYFGCISCGTVQPEKFKSPIKFMCEYCYTERKKIKITMWD